MGTPARRGKRTGFVRKKRAKEPRRYQPGLSSVLFVHGSSPDVQHSRSGEPLNNSIFDNTAINGSFFLKPIMFTAWESFVSGRSSSGIVAVTIINHCWEHRFFFEAFSIITAWEKVVSGRLLCKDRCRNVFRQCWGRKSTPSPELPLYHCLGVFVSSLPFPERTLLEHALFSAWDHIRPSVTRRVNIQYMGFHLRNSFQERIACLAIFQIYRSVHLSHEAHPLHAFEKSKNRVLKIDHAVFLSNYIFLNPSSETALEKIPSLSELSVQVSVQIKLFFGLSPFL